MLRIPAVIAVLGLSALTLVGCSTAAGGGTDAACPRPDSAPTVLDFLHVSGAQGQPQVSLDAPVYVDQTTYADLTVGTGLRVTSDAQDVRFSVAISNGATGQQILASGTQVEPLSAWHTDYHGLAQMMMCATEGSRIVGAVPATDLSPAAAQRLGLGDGQSAVVVLDLERVFLAAADGAPQYNDRAGMPSVVLAPDGRPGIIVPDAAPPGELVVEVLKKGTGPVLADTDAVRVHYTGVTWATRTVFDSTWQKGASASVTEAEVVPGFAQALHGATVGSQLLVVIPPDLGYGDKGSGAIPGGATLVYVIDILGIDDPAATTP